MRSYAIEILEMEKIHIKLRKMQFTYQVFLQNLECTDDEINRGANIINITTVKYQEGIKIIEEANQEFIIQLGESDDNNKQELFL